MDAIFETSSVFVIGNVLAISFSALRKEREYRSRLETTQQGLLASERKYRQLFENAHDAILLHDLDGNIIDANRATEELTGYNEAELPKTNVRSFLSEEGLKLAGQVRRKLLANEPLEQPYEQHIIKKDGNEVIVQSTTSLLYEQDKPSAFQHIARDITEQKRIQENLRFYLQQATKAQEEERKRISRELHDDTIQALIVLSRQLDALASDTKGLPEASQTHLENLMQQTDNIIHGVRRLSQDLRPAALDRLGLLPALERLTSDVTQYSGIVIKLNMSGTERRFTEELELMLFRITQEALRNVWKHSHATEAEVKVQLEDRSIKVTISDNGKGFNLPRNTGDLTRSGKLGLIGMQERARLVNGNFSIHSQIDKGTEIIIEVPVQS
jgi:PAS domain S-box-containing protein